MEVMEEYERVFGPMTQRQTGISGMLRKFADREAQKVERGENVSQPPTRVTDFRM